MWCNGCYIALTPLAHVFFVELVSPMHRTVDLVILIRELGKNMHIAFLERVNRLGVLGKLCLQLVRGVWQPRFLSCWSVRTG
jgi:hypothetical protein